MTALRFLAGLFLMAALIALVSDATRPLLGMGPFVPTSLGKLWAETAPKSLAAVRQGLPPILWTSLVAALLRLPTFVLLGLIGIVLGYLGRRRSRVDIYIN
jgi:hypothetical protein